MSLVEEARTVRDRVVARLRELEPLVQEYQELKEAAAALGIDASELEAEAPQQRRAPARRSSRSSSRKAKPSESQAGLAAVDDLGARVVEAVKSQPGKAVSEYARMLGVPATDLYRPVRELTDEGKLVKRTRQLFPA